MRKSLASIIWILCAFVGGCSQSGDFSRFIVTEVVHYGGQTKTDVPVAAVNARWKVNRDKNGFQVIATGTSFSAVDAVMRQAFSAPAMSGVSSAGVPHSEWAARDIGAAV